jgi:hypothetical protein
LKPSEHQPNYGAPNKRLAGGWKSLIVLAQSLMKTKPGKRPLDNPPTLQNDEAFDTIASLYDLQPYRTGRLGRVGSSCRKLLMLTEPFKTSSYGCPSLSRCFAKSLTTSHSS